MRRAKPRSHRHPCEMPLFLVSVFPGAYRSLPHTHPVCLSAHFSQQTKGRKKEKKERRKGRKKENTKKKIKHVGRHENLTRGPQLRWVPIDNTYKELCWTYPGPAARKSFGQHDPGIHRSHRGELSEALRNLLFFPRFPKTLSKMQGGH